MIRYYIILQRKSFYIFCEIIKIVKIGYYNILKRKNRYKNSILNVLNKLKKNMKISYLKKYNIIL